MSCINVSRGSISPPRGYRATVLVVHPVSRVRITGLSITLSLSSTAPVEGDLDGTPIADTTVTMTATSTPGEYEGILGEAVTIPACAGLQRVWAIIDGPNVYEVTVLTVLAPS